MRITKFKMVMVTIAFVFTGVIAKAQKNNVIDEVVAVVGGNIILKSDIEERFLEMQSQGALQSGGDDVRCGILETLLVQKLLLAEAELDTLIEVSDSQVSNELTSTIERYYKFFGSTEAIEKYFKKPLFKIKSDMREVLKENLMTQQKQQMIVSEVTVTPSEVRQYYRAIDTEDLVDVPAQVEYSQIVIKPKVAEKEELKVKTQLRTLKRRVEEGASFASFAVLYSEGPSASKGGDLEKYMGKTELDPAFSEAAFALEPGEVSGVVESTFGFHIIQLIDKKENKIRCRHILLRAKVDMEEQERASGVLDSIRTKLVAGELDWNKSAYFYSSDKDSRNNGGVVLNAETMSTKFSYDKLDADVSKKIDSLEEGEISPLFWSKDKKDAGVFKIIKVDRKIPKHKAEIGEDYQILADMFTAIKREKAFDEWVEDNKANTYIRIDESFKDCAFKHVWLQ